MKNTKWQLLNSCSFFLEKCKMLGDKRGVEKFTSDAF